MSQCKKANSRQESLEPSSVENNASFVTLHPRGTGSSSSEYVDVQQMLLNLHLYQPLFLNDLAPIDQFERRKWLAALSLPFSVMLYRYAYGNNLGTLSYLWRIPPEDEPIDNTAVSHVFSELRHQQSFYSTRAMRQDFLSKYSRLANVSKMILHNIYHTHFCMKALLLSMNLKLKWMNVWQRLSYS